MDEKDEEISLEETEIIYLQADDVDDDDLDAVEELDDDDEEELDDEEESDDDDDLDAVEELDDEEGSLWNVTQLSEAKQKLDTWSLVWEVDDDPYVEGLSEALETQNNMTMWAAFDPTDRLPFPEPKRGGAFKRLADLFALIRNVLVFLPVAITWIAISKATKAFSEYNKTKEVGEDLNFLEFWSNSANHGYLDDKSFGLLDPKIQDVAYLGFAIISLIIFLTLLSSAFSVYASRVSLNSEKNADLQRKDVSISLLEALEGKRTASPDSIAGTIADVLNDLNDASRGMREAALRVEQASSEVSGFTPSLQELNRNFEHLAANVSTEIATAINELGRSLETLNTETLRDSTQMLSQVLSNLDAIGDQLGRTSASVEFGVGQLREDLQEIHDRLT
jgi:methyl-accepting chemotaxis protein